MNGNRVSKDQRPSWISALIWLLAPIVLIMTLRWLLIEPYVIPSGSMIPNLLVHDHILVNKLRFGIRVPFKKQWIWNWSRPQRGEVVVFRYPENPEVFYVKRVWGLPGEKISVKSGVIYINGEALPLTPAENPFSNSSMVSHSNSKNDSKEIDPPNSEESQDDHETEASESPDSELAEDDRFHYFNESGHLVRYLSSEESNYEEFEIPEKSYFMIGDNRDQSNDSRSWGVVPEENLIGVPTMIWLSCSETIESAKFLCDPTQIRWNRLLIKVK